jgi:hypothetical protein
VEAAVEEHTQPLRRSSRSDRSRRAEFCSAEEAEAAAGEYAHAADDGEEEDGKEDGEEDGEEDGDASETSSMTEDASDTEVIKYFSYTGMTCRSNK